MSGTGSSKRRWLKARYALAWHATNVLVGFLFSAAFVIVDPLNLDEGVSRRGRDLFYGVMAFAYPERSPRTAVVLMGDRFLQEQDLAWPAPYAVHAGVLEEIAARRPRAIVMDMVVIDRRQDDIRPLIETIARVAHDTPVYIGAEPVREDSALARPEILRLTRTHPGVRLVTLRRGAPVGSGFAYRLEAEGDRRPPAVALYEDLVARGPFRPRRPGDEMDIWWAAPKDRFNCRGAATEHACGMIGQSVAARVLTLALAAIVPIFPDQDRLTAVEVPRAPTIDVLDLINGDAAEQIDPALRGAVVFYGLALSFVGDTEQTPLQASTPGVQAHAMAFDNLVALNGRYVSAQAPFGLPAKAHTLLMLLAMSVALLLGRIAATAARPSWALQPHLRGRPFGLLDAAVLVVAALAMAVYEFKGLGVGPSAWATVLLAAWTGDLLTTRGFAGAALVRVLGRRKTAALAVRPKPRWRR